MTNGKTASPKPATAGRSRTAASPAATKRSAAGGSAGPTTKTMAPSARQVATTPPMLDGATTLSAQERHALVAQAAYLRAQARGFAAGRELDDWVAAESEVDTQLANG